MKTNHLLTTFVLLLFGAMAHLGAQESPTSDKAKPETLLIEVKGMVCSFCVVGIEKSFKRLDQVRDIFVDLGKSMVAVTLKPGEKMDDDMAAKTVKDSGYEIEKISRTEQSAAEIREAAKKK
ncbi:heavy metal-associated domain-containing protein [Oscillatoria amoena NRMC-F 0135]|nr:heavy metal-associated domain-containing protein [Oscillatoria laete-virens]MDL5046240.1 heavy metal-associated domain-containing protein [Oscillatoria amoena NRMC-F 0135]MDL5053934.1 heavy metal-associated domain-containing protein [Oscillatoria laete-virens NRMC-F 0139]